MVAFTFSDQRLSDTGFTVLQTKNITIVQANNLLLGETYPEKFRVDLERRVQRRDVNIIFNDTIEGRPDPKGTLATSKGISLPCDLIVSHAFTLPGQKFLHLSSKIYARGGRPNTTIFNFLQPSVLSDRGYVKVNSKLQVHGHHNIFALGDIIDWPEPKQLTKILFGHAPVVISNVMSYLEGRPLKKEYTKSIEIMAVSIGKVIHITPSIVHGILTAAPFYFRLEAHHILDIYGGLLLGVTSLDILSPVTLWLVMLAEISDFRRKTRQRRFRKRGFDILWTND